MGGDTRIRAGAWCMVTAALLVGPPAGAQETPHDVSVEVAVYLSEALSTLRDNAFRRNDVDWPQLRRQVFQAAAGARVPADAYQAVRVALRGLGDHHSFLQLSAELRALEEERRALRGLSSLDSGADDGGGGPPSPFSGRREAEGHLHGDGPAAVGRIVIPRFGGRDVDGFAGRIQALLRELLAARPCGWVVDLRGNGGGNMWPMLAGIGPVLGEGGLGAFRGVEGVQGRWYYRDGVAGMEGVGEVEGFEGARVADPLVLEAAPPVAVLVDGGTGSSGEAVAIAFKGRPDTRFFGTPTAGVSTSNRGFRLPDGANMVVTVGLDVDREGTEYPTDVRPDEEIPPPASPDDPDPQLERALEWLGESPACGGRPR